MGQLRNAQSSSHASGTSGDHIAETALASRGRNFGDGAFDRRRDTCGESPFSPGLKINLLAM